MRVRRIRRGERMEGTEKYRNENEKKIECIHT